MPLHAQPSLFGKVHLLWIKASFSLTIGRKVCSRSKLKLFVSFALQLLSWRPCLSSLARHYEFQGRKKSQKSELQHSKVQIFTDDQQIKDQNSAHKFRRDKYVNLPSCPAKHHFVILRGRIRFSGSRDVCVCTVINCCPPRGLSKDQDKAPDRVCMKGCAGSSPLCSMKQAGVAFPHGWLHSEGRFPMGFLQASTTGLHSTGLVHKILSELPAPSCWKLLMFKVRCALGKLRPVFWALSKDCFSGNSLERGCVAEPQGADELSFPVQPWPRDHARLVW